MLPVVRRFSWFFTLKPFLPYLFAIFGMVREKCIEVYLKKRTLLRKTVFWFRQSFESNGPVGGLEPLIRSGRLLSASYCWQRGFHHIWSRKRWGYCPIGWVFSDLSLQLIISVFILAFPQQIMSMWKFYKNVSWIVRIYSVWLYCLH